MQTMDKEAMKTALVPIARDNPQVISTMLKPDYGFYLGEAVKPVRKSLAVLTISRSDGTSQRRRPKRRAGQGSGAGTRW